MMDIQDLDQFKFKESDELSLDTPVAHVRLPWRWESAKKGLNYMFNQGFVDNPLENAICDLVDVLKEEGFKRSSDKPFTFVIDSGIEISTKEWVLKRARPQTILRSLILGQVGALDHIVESLHYDIVWNVVNFRGSSNWPDPAEYWIRDMSSKEYKG
jgi:hypothetical protein